ncbi:OLC1v1016113C1 [Oldenlandia corymbosa var. corymbosa]|uniref:OLC1v1016113C1 n=1 Tax=Oldenlandia corymbosa var. corymbosa TaxID=529605 RepID=A0AAV1E5A0_OLDCO|nr:OLC1v1016113C1 [Oldenlandia corymbosa var. corymbosa]
MTPTLLDVCVITGLPVIADVAVDSHVTDDDAAVAAAGQLRSYGPFINENKGHTSRLHHIRFPAMWLNRYVFPRKSFQMTMDWYHVVGKLASGVQMNLAEAILAMLYHCLHEARHNPVDTLSGPLWLLHFWLYMYFLSLKPKGIHPVESGEPLCLVVHQYSAPNYDATQVFKTVFESTPNIEASVQQLSHDWWHKSFGEVCHAEAENGKWSSHGKFGLASVWSHLLSVRDLFYGCKSAQSRNVVADMHVENYPANMVARQFGFAQSVPHFDVSCWNTGRLGREKLTMSQYTTHRVLMDLRGRSAATIPFNFCFDVTPGFADWWYELSIGMYSSGFEAIKTSFGIGKFAKNKSVGGVAETKKKGDTAAKSGGQSSTKRTDNRRCQGKKGTGKDAPTSTRRSKRLIGKKRSATEISNKENPVSVSKSEEEETECPGSKKGSIAVAEDRVVQKTVLDIGGARSKKVMKTSSSSAPTASGKKAPPSLESLKARLERTKAAAYVRIEETSRVPEMPLVAALQQITEMFPLSAEEVYNERYDQLSQLLAVMQNSIIEGNMAAAIRLVSLIMAKLLHKSITINFVFDEQLGVFPNIGAIYLARFHVIVRGMLVPQPQSQPPLLINESKTATARREKRNGQVGLQAQDIGRIKQLQAWGGSHDEDTGCKAL